MKQSYKYTGKERSAAGDVWLEPEGTYELEPEDAHVKSLVAKGFLVKTEPAKTNSKPTINTKTETK